MEFFAACVVLVVFMGVLAPYLIGCMIEDMAGIWVSSHWETYKSGVFAIGSFIVFMTCVSSVALLLGWSLKVVFS